MQCLVPFTITSSSSLCACYLRTPAHPLPLYPRTAKSGVLGKRRRGAKTLAGLPCQIFLHPAFYARSNGAWATELFEPCRPFRDTTFHRPTLQNVNLAVQSQATARLGILNRLLDTTKRMWPPRRSFSFYFVVQISTLIM